MERPQTNTSPGHFEAFNCELSMLFYGDVHKVAVLAVQ